MPTMEVINERFARNIRIGLFNFIRKSPEVAIGGIKVQKYSAFLREIVVPTNFNIVSVKPLRGSGLIVCDPNLVFAVIDALFGGAGKFHTRIEGRDFSPTEQRVILRLVEVIIAEYRKAWTGIYPLELEYQRSEMQPQFANIATPSEIVVATSFTLEIGDTTGHGALLHPVLDAGADPRRAVFDHPGRLGRARPALGQPAASSQIQSAEVELVAELATRRPRWSSCCRSSRATSSSSTSTHDPSAKVDGVPVFDCHYGTVQRPLLDQDRSIADHRIQPGLAGRPETMSAEPHPAPCPKRTDGRRMGRRAGREQARRRRGGQRGAAPAESVAPASFTELRAHGANPGAGNDINMILDIPVQLTVELGRTRIPIKHILQLAQGSVVELDALAGEPMDVLVNGFLIAQGEVVVVNDKFGIRLTDIVTPSERMRRLSKAPEHLEPHAAALAGRRHRR
jgi:flagellar motor switch protein FliM